MKKNLLFFITYTFILIILMYYASIFNENQKNNYFNSIQENYYHYFDFFEFQLSRLLTESLSFEDFSAIINSKKDKVYDIHFFNSDNSVILNTQTKKHPLSPSIIGEEIVAKLKIPLDYLSFNFVYNKRFYVVFLKNVNFNNSKWHIVLTSDQSLFHKSWRRSSFLIYLTTFLIWTLFSICLVLVYFYKVKKHELFSKKDRESLLLNNLVTKDYQTLSVLINDKSEIENVSPSLLSFLSYTEEELVTKKLFSIVPDFDLSKTLFNLNILEKPNNQEIAVLDKYNMKYSFLTTFVPYYNMNNEIYKILIIFNDLTPIKESNKKLKIEINKNIILSKIAHSIISSNDSHSIIKTIVEESKNLIEYDSGTLFLFDGTYLIPYYTNDSDLKEKVSEIKIKIGQGLSGLVAKIKKGMIVNDAGNSPIAMSVEDTPDIEECLISSPLINNNNLIGVMTFSRLGKKPFKNEDLKTLELLSVQTAAVLDNSMLLEKLKKSESKYNSLINESALAIMIIVNKKIVFCNKRLSEFLDYQLEQLLGKDIVDLIINKDKSMFASQLTTFLLDGKTDVFEIELLASNEKNVVMEFSLSSIDWEEQTSILITASNITEKIELNKQLLQTQKLESVGALASGIAHDFKNVLAGITGAADMILLKTDETSPINNFAKIIKTSADRGTRLSQRLLGFSRKEDYESQVFDINELLQEIIEIISYTFEKNIELISNLSEEPLFFEGDPVKIQQCLLNLCVNARDAMPMGGKLKIQTMLIRDTNQVKEKWDKIDNRFYILIVISDTGIGIPDDIQSTIFDPFFTTKEKGKGTGLGLSTTKSIVTDYKGNIFVDSKINEGTSFLLYLPWIEHYERKINSQPSITDVNSHSVLLVDDEEIVLDVAKDLLEELGSTVYAVDNGFDALKVIKTHSDIEIALIDRMMPKMDGLTLLKKIKELKPDIKVIIASGFIQESEIKDFKKFGAFDYISKPYRLEELVKILKDF